MMLKCLLPMVFLFVMGCRPPADSETSKTVLEEILKLSKAKNYDQIKGLVYPYPKQQGALFQGTFIFYIKEADKKHTGDFSYSDEALEILIQKHGHQFSSEFEINWMDDFYKMAPELKKVPKSDFQLLDVKGIHILMVKKDGKYRLLFWEGMNHILEKEK